MKKIIAIICSLLILILGLFFLYKTFLNQEGYLAGKDHQVSVYTDKDMNSTVQLTRATVVEYRNKVLTSKGKELYEFAYNGRTLYAPVENIVESRLETLLLEEVKLLANANVYSDYLKPEINSKIDSGTVLKVEQSLMNKDGTIKWLRVANGYIRGEYLVANDDSIKNVVDDNNGISYFPAVEQEDVKTRKAITVELEALGPDLLSYLEEHDFNNVILEVKESDSVNVFMQSTGKYNEMSFNTASYLSKDLNKELKILKEAGIKTSALVSVFDDSTTGANFLDVMDYEVWYYYLDFITELSELGFDEVILNGYLIERNDLDLKTYRTMTQLFNTYLLNNIEDIELSMSIDENYFDDQKYNIDFASVMLSFENILFEVIPTDYERGDYGASRPWRYTGTVGKTIGEMLGDYATKFGLEKNISIYMQAYNMEILSANKTFIYVDHDYVQNGIVGFKSSGQKGGFALLRYNVSNVDDYTYLRSIVW